MKEIEREKMGFFGSSNEPFKRRVGSGAEIKGSSFNLNKSFVDVRVFINQMVFHILIIVN